MAASKVLASFTTNAMSQDFLDRLSGFTFIVGFSHLHLNQIITLSRVVRLLLVATHRPTYDQMILVYWWGLLMKEIGRWLGHYSNHQMTLVYWTYRTK